MLADLPTAPWFRRAIVAALIVGILLLTYSVLQPFLVPLIWGGILAYVSWPLNRRFLKLCGDRITLAAFSTTLAVTLLLVVPLIWLFLMLRVEAVNAYVQVQAFLASKPELPQALRDLPWGVGEWLQAALQQLSADPDGLRRQMMQIFEHSTSDMTRLIGGVTRNVAKLFFAVLSMFFLLRDGPRVFGEVRAILEGFFGQAVVYAIILGAIAQGAVAGLGYWMFDVNAPAMMGAVTALIAMIPFGAPVVWVSLSIWLLLTGDIWNGTGLMLWGILVVSWVDNIVRPLVISNATRMPFLLVVFGVLGGVLAFGLVGLFVGPVLLAVSLALWREWLEQHQPVKE
jgi:predicted PurR-regulated permease PerM